MSWLQSPSAVILELKKLDSVTVSIVSPSIYREVMKPAALILVFLMLNFKPAFSLSSFTFIKRLFSSSLLSDRRVVSFAYLFLPAILIPACASSSLTFHKMYSAFKLNKQGDNIQPWHTPLADLEDSRSKRWSKFTEFTFLFKSSLSIHSYISQKKAYIILSSFTDI